MTAVSIRECTEPTELFRQYQGESQPQPVYLELDLETGALSADYNAEIGTAVPIDVHHGFTRRYSIPILTAAAANQAMRDIAPLAARVLADWESHWDGNNHRAVLGSDAEAADAAIDAHLGDYRYSGSSAFSEADQVAVWGLDFDGSELVDQYGIRADSTDADLDRIEKKILDDLVSCGESTVCVCPGLDELLEQLRQDLRDDA